jgi:hypothetical protein
MKLSINIFLAITLLAIPVVGGANADKLADDPGAAETTWVQFNVVERILNLKSSDTIRWLYFRADGSVSATLGGKAEGKRAILCSYRIVDNWLHIMDYYGKVIYQMRLLRVEKDEVVVENGSGDIERYEFYRNTPDKK